MLGRHLLISCVLILGLSSCRGGPGGSESEAQSAIRQIEEDWAATAVSGDTAVIQRILADDFLGVSPDGVLYTKDDFIREMKTNPDAFTANHVNEVKVRLFDRVAVAQGNETFARKSGEAGRFVWTDTLVLRGGRWQIIAAEDVIAPVSPPESSDRVFVRPTDTSGIDTTRAAYMAAWKAADAEQIAKLYAQNALVLYPDRPPVSGRDAIREYFRGFFADFRDNEILLMPAEIQIAGNWAFDRGSYRWHATPRAGGAALSDEGKYLVILVREPSGQWRVARDMDNSDQPQAQRSRNQQ